MVNTKFSFPFLLTRRIHWCRSWTVPLQCNRPHMWRRSCHFLFIGMGWCLKYWIFGQGGIYSTYCTNCSSPVLSHINFYLISEHVVCLNLLQFVHRLGNLWGVEYIYLLLSRILESPTKKYISFESRWCIFEISRIRRMLSILTTGEYVFQYLSPHCYMPLWAHSQYLCFSSSPSGFWFHLKYQIAFIECALFGSAPRWKIDQWPPSLWSVI